MKKTYFIFNPAGSIQAEQKREEAINLLLLLNIKFRYNLNNEFKNRLYIEIAPSNVIKHGLDLHLSGLFTLCYSTF